MPTKIIPINSEFRLEFGESLRSGLQTIRVMQERNGLEFAQADRCWSTGELRFQVNTVRMGTLEHLDNILAALAALREHAKELPPYGGVPKDPSKALGSLQQMSAAPAARSKRRPRDQ